MNATKWICLCAIALCAMFLVISRQSSSERASKASAARQDDAGRPTEVKQNPASLREFSNAKTPAPKMAPATPVMESAAPATDKADRLTQIRDQFKALALGGDHLGAIRAAKELKDPNEKETALLALVTEWTKGNLRHPVGRAQAISEFGLEAALGMEIATQPALATLWADEMTEGEGRAAIMRQIAKAMVQKDPATAFAYSDQIPTEGQARFNDELYQYWARVDTASAMRWAEQLPEPEKDDAVKSIRQVAPVGIGAALRTEGGYTVITDLIPGSAAELNGQLRVGDRLLAIAQGDQSFADAHNLSLQDVVGMIRGEPNTVVKLRVLGEDAGPDAKPRTISITRGQINFNTANPPSKP